MCIRDRFWPWFSASLTICLTRCGAQVARSVGADLAAVPGCLLASGALGTSAVSAAVAEVVPAPPAGRQIFSQVGLATEFTVAAVSHGVGVFGTSGIGSPARGRWAQAPRGVPGRGRSGMFWEHPDWKQVPEPEVRAAIELVRSAVTSDPVFFLTKEEAKDDLRADSLVISSVRVRKLTFLPDHWLYELQVSLDEHGLRARYESARGYAIVALTRNVGSDSGPRDEPPHTRMDHVRRGAGVTLVNWQVGTIFELLERAEIQLDDSGELDPDRTIEYLDFFVSFTASEMGKPLLLLRGGTLNEPEGVERRGVIPFDEVISSRRSPRDPASLSRADDPDVTSTPEPSEQTGLEPPAPVRDDEPISDVAVDPNGAKASRSLRLTGTG